MSPPPPEGADELVTDYVPLGNGARRPRIAGIELAIVMLLLLLSGTVNFVLLKVLYAAYGERHAFFVSQGVNVLYVVYGGICVYPRLLPFGVGEWLSTSLGVGPITSDMRALRHLRGFFVMGLLDCFGTFLTAMGNVFTPGTYQTLINQSLIPATMIASFGFLGTRYSLGQIFAAVLIVGGAAVTIVPKLLDEARGAPDAAHPYSADEVRGYAVAMYWLSNVPMACSTVYKEARFSREPMDVTYLTQWVSIWQMLLGFCLAPVQIFPGVGSADGQSWEEIFSSFGSGWQCFLADPSIGCSARHTFLLFAYVLINFFFNTLGLYLTKHGGAVLNSITYSLLLPLTSVAFSLPLLGDFCESVKPSTYVGLAVVMLGFALWRWFQHRLDMQIALEALAAQQPLPTADGGAAEPTLGGVDANRRLSSPPSSNGASPMLKSTSSVPPPSFQERVVGIGHILPAGAILVDEVGECGTDGKGYGLALPPSLEDAVDSTTTVSVLPSPPRLPSGQSALPPIGMLRRSLSRP